MALSPGSKERLLAAGTRLQDLASNSLKDLLDDVRWFTTLVLAAIGALGAYRQLGGAKSLSLPIAIVVVLLCLTLFVFLITVIMGNYMKRHFNKAIHGFEEEVLKVDGDNSLAPIEENGFLSRVSLFFGVSTPTSSSAHKHFTLLESPHSLSRHL